MIQHVQHVIELELYKSIDRIHVPIVVRANDNDSQRIVAKIRQRGQFINLDCDSARLDIVRENGTWARIDATVTGYTATCDLPSEAIASAGTVRLAYFVFIKGNQVQTTENFALRIEDAAAESAESDAYFDSSVNHIAEKWKAFEATAEQIESDRQTTENARKEAETAREQAESEREQAESEREQAETNRNNAEDTRKQNENERIRKENERIEHDTKVMSAESERIRAEQARVAEETSRTEAENERKQNESTRKAQEGARVTEEEARKTRFAQMMDAAQNVKFKIVEADENGKPKGEGAAGIIYLVRSNTDSTINEYTEWIWYENKWELFGTSGATIDPVTVQDINKVAQGDSISGTRVLSATALNYLWLKLKEKYQTQTQVIGAINQATTPITQQLQTLDSRADTARDECKRLDAVKASQLDVSNVRDELQRTKTTLTSRVQNLSETVNNNITSLQRSVNTRIQDALNQASQAASNFTVLKSRLAALDLKVTRDTGWQVYWQSSQDSSSRIIYKVYGNTVTVSVCVLDISGKWEVHVQDSPLTQKFANYYPDEGLYCACNVIQKYGSKDTGATTTMYVSSRKEQSPYIWFYGNGGGDYYSVGTLTYTLSDYQLPNNKGEVYIA